MGTVLIEVSDEQAQQLLSGIEECMALSEGRGPEEVEQPYRQELQTLWKLIMDARSRARAQGGQA